MSNLYREPTKLGSFGQAVSEEKIFVGIDQLLKKEIMDLYSLLRTNYNLVLMWSLQ